jgi:hypothetical protein
MKFAKGTDGGRARRHDTDVVSVWLLRLAIGMMAIGILFAALDQSFHESTEQPRVPHVAVAA